jgi:NADH:ubiquinone oxidoreductase subunit F (NADH-binding)
VYEVPAGTPVSDVLALAEVSNGSDDDDVARSDEGVVVVPSFVLLGVSNSVLTADQLDTPLSHEAFQAIGSGLGSASFIVFTDETDPVAVAAGASRFLAVESCGQCTPCKHDGLEISSILTDLTAGTAPPDALERLDQRLATVADGARCSLATQHQAVIGSIRRAFPDRFEQRAPYGIDPLAPLVVSELLSLGPTHQEIDTRFAEKQPDWTYDATDSGRTPVELATDSREG